MMNRFSFIFGAVLLALAAVPATGRAQYTAFDDPGAAANTGVVGGGLVASTPTVDGGSVPMGSTAQVVVRFRNDGAQAVQTGLIRLYPSSNVGASVALDQCKEEPLRSGAECAIALTVKGLQPGPWRVEMLMAHSGRTRLVSATLSGSVETIEGAGDKISSDIEMAPDLLDFGTLSASQTLVEQVILRNVTSNKIEISDIYIEASKQAGYTLKTACKELSAGQSCLAAVSWSPKAPGRSSGVLVVKHNGPAGLSSVPLKGDYVPGDVAKATVFPQAVPGRGLLVSSQEEVDFGEGIEKSSTMTISLVNSGEAPLTLQDIRSSGSENGISFKKEGCLAGTVLKPVEACPLTVEWSPTRIGNVYDDVQILHDGARGVLVLPVRGKADAAVSQDQKTIVLSKNESDEFSDVPPLSEEALMLGGEDVPEKPSKAAVPSVVNPAGVLDGYKITSFSGERAMIKGPSGSRLVFNDEAFVLGGVSWKALFQKNGIEFVYQGQRVLLLFDKSLSPINTGSAAAGTSAAASTSSSGETDLTSTSSTSTSASSNPLAFSSDSSSTEDSESKDSETEDSTTNSSTTGTE